jgi:hypothetical protein
MSGTTPRTSWVLDRNNSVKRSLFTVGSDKTRSCLLCHPRATSLSHIVTFFPGLCVKLPCFQDSSRGTVQRSATPFPVSGVRISSVHISPDGNPAKSLVRWFQRDERCKDGNHWLRAIYEAMRPCVFDSINNCVRYEQSVAKDQNRFNRHHV